MYEFLLIIHLLSLAGGLGISLTMFVLGLHAAKMPPGEAGPFMGRVAGAMRPVSITAVTLLVLSGFGLVAVAGAGIVEAGGWWFRAKMLFVVALVAAFVMVQINQARARRGENPPVAAARAGRYGRVALASATMAVILAVIAFE